MRMGDGYYPNRQLIVLDRVDNPIQSLAQPIPFLAGQFLRPPRPRVLGERIDTLEDFLHIFFGYFGEVPSLKRDKQGINFLLDEYVLDISP